MLNFCHYFMHLGHVVASPPPLVQARREPGTTFTLSCIYSVRRYDLSNECSIVLLFLMPFIQSQTISPYIHIKTALVVTLTFFVTCELNKS